MNTRLRGIVLVAVLSACGPVDDGLATGARDVDPTTGTPAGSGGSTHNVAQNNAAATHGEDPRPIVDATNSVSAGGAFAELYDIVFAEAGCSGGRCHGAAMGTAEAMHSFLVGKPARAQTSCGPTLLVAPGEPEESILWYRIRPPSMDDSGPCTTKMPGDSQGLSEDAAMRVYDWIADGAQL